MALWPSYLNVPLERSTELKEGLTVELLDDAGKVVASNPVTFVAPRADDATQSVLVKATLRRRPAGLRVMQYVKARLVFANEPALVVPVVAVNRIAGQHFVFVAEAAKDGFVARQKPITVGTVVDDSYVVLRGLAVMAVFFAAGSAATRLGYRVKAARGIAQESGGARDYRSAWANGGVPALLALLAAAAPEPLHGLFVLGYAASVAAAAADTCSSEIGKAYGRRTVLATSAPEE